MYSRVFKTRSSFEAGSAATPPGAERLTTQKNCHFQMTFTRVGTQNYVSLEAVAPFLCYQSSPSSNTKDCNALLQRHMKFDAFSGQSSWAEGLHLEDFRTCATSVAAVEPFAVPPPPLPPFVRPCSDYQHLFWVFEWHSTKLLLVFVWPRCS